MQESLNMSFLQSRRVLSVRYLRDHRDAKNGYPNECENECGRTHWEIAQRSCNTTYIWPSHWTYQLQQNGINENIVSRDQINPSLGNCIEMFHKNPEAAITPSCNKSCWTCQLQPMGENPLADPADFNHFSTFCNPTAVDDPSEALHTRGIVGLAAGGRGSVD